MPFHVYTAFNSFICEFNLFYGLHLSLVVFLLSLFGIFYNRRNFLITLLCIELILFSIVFLFILFSIYLNLYLGVVYALLTLTVAAAETAIGLSILVIYYRLTHKVMFDALLLLRG